MSKRRYPLAPLVTASGVTEHELSKRIGLTGTPLKRAREQGLSEAQADRYAVRAGFVPWLVWPEWLEDVIADVSVVCAADDCDERFVPTRKGHRYCSPRCKQRTSKRRRYQADPEFAEELRRRVRAYGEECRKAERARNRRYRQEHAEELKAKRAAYYQANRERLLAKQRDYDASRRSVAA